MDTQLLVDLATELPHGVRLQRLANWLRQRFRCGAVGLLRLEGDCLQPMAVDGLVREALGRRFVIAQHPRLAAIMGTRKPVYFDHDSGLPDPYDGLLESQVGIPLPVHDCMGVSIHVEGKPWGALTLDALETGTFDAEARAALGYYGLIVEAAVRVTRLEQERRSLRLHRSDQQAGLLALENNDILGNSEVIASLLRELDVVACSDLPVLLLGETGVGKELFARRLHARSQRKGQPLIYVNCAALPESLAESELFGHLKGAFSGAGTDRAGRFEVANGGTLLLDEIGELPLGVQAKLLRTLQNGEIQRLGEDRPRHVDVRIIAATNRRLSESVRTGHFRADLYHRLSVYPVQIPPLRERGADVLLLAGHYLETNRARLGVRSLRLSADAEEALCHYPWPGNVRELEHLISRAALKALSAGANPQDIITLDAQLLDLDMPPTAVNDSMRQPGSEKGAPGTMISMQDTVARAQRRAIREALHANQGNWAASARDLGLDPSNLRKLAQRLGVK